MVTVDEAADDIPAEEGGEWDEEEEGWRVVAVGMVNVVRVLGLYLFV